MKKFFYRVEEGETVFSIANKFSIPPSLLIKDNLLNSEVSAGDLLIVRPPLNRLYKVRPEDTILSISKRFNISEEEILINNCIPYIFYGLTIVL